MGGNFWYPSHWREIAAGIKPEFEVNEHTGLATTTGRGLLGDQAIAELETRDRYLEDYLNHLTTSANLSYAQTNVTKAGYSNNSESTFLTGFSTTLGIGIGLDPFQYGTDIAVESGGNGLKAVTGGVYHVTLSVQTSLASAHVCVAMLGREATPIAHTIVGCASTVNPGGGGNPTARVVTSVDVACTALDQIQASVCVIDPGTGAAVAAGVTAFLSGFFICPATVNVIPPPPS